MPLANVDALTNALAGLSVAKSRIDTISRNVANASTVGYTRKVQGQTTTTQGVVLAGDITRMIDETIARAVREHTGNQARLETKVNMLSQIESVLGPPDQNGALSAAMTKLQTAFQDLSVSPQKDANYVAAVGAADDLARSFQSIWKAVDTQRVNAQNQLVSAVSTLNDTLRRLDQVNKSVLTANSGEVAQLEDERDRLLTTLSELMDVTTFRKASGEVAVYTTGGVPLVDATARTVTLEELGAKQTTAPAPPVIVVKNGKIGALLEMRDIKLPQIASQLDDMARAITDEFQKPPINIVLFNDGGSTPFDPADPTQLTGYAARISVNNDLRAAPTKIRDGNSPTPLDPGDTQFIDKALAFFSRTDVAFTAATGLPASGNLIQVATDFVAQRGVDREVAEDALANESAVKQAFDLRQSEISGVNIDDEVGQLVLFQQVYAANARIIDTAKTMFETLFDAVR